MPVARGLSMEPVLVCAKTPGVVPTVWMLMSVELWAVVIG